LVRGFVGVAAATYVCMSLTPALLAPLHVKRSATEREIKKAFKAMSLKFHPDKNKDDDNALKKF